MDKTEKLIDWKEDERKDANRDGIDDDLEPPIPDVSAGSQKLAERLREHTDTNPILSGGDIDARWEDADSSGEEAVAGSAPTPGQDNVDEIGEALGITYQDNEELRVGEKEEDRDKKRWELDPASSDDYQDRIREDKNR
jgi:hypothetical protein